MKADLKVLACRKTEMFGVGRKGERVAAGIV
jgi:hypothetical protein